MFVAYEAIPITPQTLDTIRIKLGSDEEFDKWEAMLMSCVKKIRLQYIIFNLVENLHETCRGHVVVLSDDIKDHYEVAKFNKDILWITKRK